MSSFNSPDFNRFSYIPDSIPFPEPDFSRFDYFSRFRTSYVFESLTDKYNRALREANERVRAAEAVRVSEVAKEINQRKEANARTREVLGAIGIDIRSYLRLFEPDRYEVIVNGVIIARVAREETACQIGVEITAPFLAGQPVDATQYADRN